jgi:hypothetical protein
MSAESMKNINGLMSSYSGVMIDVSHMSIEDVRLQDIAHALSMQCRYNGHVKKFYSVAEHSVLLAEHIFVFSVDPKAALYALLHDGSEAYLGDIVRPIKGLMLEYLNIERHVQTVIFERFGIADLEIEWQRLIDLCDHRILINEKDALLNENIIWNVPYVALPNLHIKCMVPGYAEAAFLSAVHKYCEMMRGNSAA